MVPVYHLWHLLCRSFIAMPSRISGNWIAVGFGIFVAGIGPAIEFYSWKTGRSKVKPALSKTVKDALVTSAFSWAGLFVLSTAIEIYHTHIDEVGRWKAVVNEKNNLKHDLFDKDSYIHRLEQRKCSSCVVKSSAAGPPITYRQFQIKPNIGLDGPPTSPNKSNPGVEVIVTAEQEISYPAFDVVCDRPCSYSYGYALMEASKADVVPTKDTNVVKVEFSVPALWVKGKQLAMDFRSLDEKPIRVERFKLIRSTGIGQ